MRAFTICLTIALAIFVGYGITRAITGKMAVAGVTAVSYMAAAGPEAVAEITAEWEDATRKRAVPVKIYYPKQADKPCPVIIFSHGLGGSRDGYAYLGQHWASYGYLVLHVTHIGSDTSVWKGQGNPLAAMHNAALDPQNALNRQKDITFVLDELTTLNGADKTLKGRMDLARVGIAGHSFGSFTTLVAAGMGGPLNLPEPRMKAGIAISSPVLGNKEFYPLIYARIKTPLLHITGTKDVIEDTADLRRVPYDNIHNADQYLVTFKNADHIVFSGKRLTGKELPGDTTINDDTLICTTAFWDAYLRDDPAAKKWLAGEEFPHKLGADGVWEKRLK